MVIALVADSNALVPPDLRARFDVDVVPLTVVVDGVPYDEGVNLTTAAFYERLAAGAEVSPAAPAPGVLLGAYERAAARGSSAALCWPPRSWIRPFRCSSAFSTTRHFRRNSNSRPEHRHSPI